MPYATASRSFILPGVDYTSLACISMSDLQQGSEYASPASDIGFNIVGSSVPDIGTYPELARFLWVNATTGEINFYDGTAWRQATAAASISAGSLDLNVFDVSGELAYGILRVNSSSTAVEVVAFSTLIADGSIPITKLTPSASNGVMVVTDSGTVQWMSYSTFFNTMLASATFPISQLSKGPAGAVTTYLTTNAAGTVVSWAALDIVGGIGTGTLPINKLVGGTDTYVMTMVGTTPTWVAPAAAPPISKEVQSLDMALPALASKSAGIDCTSLGGAPKRMQLTLRCVADDPPGPAPATQFFVGDTVDCSTAVQESNGDHAFMLYYQESDKKVYIIRREGSGGSPGLYLYNVRNDGGATVGGVSPLLTDASWRLDFYAWA